MSDDSVVRLDWYGRKAKEHRLKPTRDLRFEAMAFYVMRRGAAKRRGVEKIVVTGAKTMRVGPLVAVDAEGRPVV